MAKEKPTHMQTIKQILIERMTTGLKADGSDHREMQRDYNLSTTEHTNIADKLRAVITNGANPNEVFCYAHLLAYSGRYDLLAPILDDVKRRCNS